MNEMSLTKVIDPPSSQMLPLEAKYYLHLQNNWESAVRNNDTSIGQLLVLMASWHRVSISIEHNARETVGNEAKETAS